MCLLMCWESLEEVLLSKPSLFILNIRGGKLSRERKQHSAQTGAGKGLLALLSFQPCPLLWVSP